MIDKITLYNFKCFTEQLFNFKNLTLLAGGNGAGKSSLIQALLIQDSAMKSIDNKSRMIKLNGEYSLNLGESKNILSTNHTRDEVAIYSDFKDADSFAALYEIDETQRYSLALKSHSTVLAAHKMNMTYLSAERLGPRINYDAKQASNDLDVGYQGEYFTYCIFQADEIYRGKIDTTIDLFPEKKFSANVEFWLNTIVPEVKLKLESLNKSGLIEIEYSNSSDESQNYFLPTMTGFGISYVLPIITAGLLAFLKSDNSLFIVENPEVHLHPYGQSQIGKFLALLSAFGVQVIVETHSDHVLNGIRYQMAKLRTTNDLKIIHFKGPEKKYEVEELIVDANGELNTWPNGFFDQDKKDLLEIVKLKRLNNGRLS